MGLITERLKGASSRAGRLMLGGALAVALTPALAFAADVSAQHYDYNNTSGKVTFDKDGNPLGSDVELLSADAANHTYKYRGYAHSDNGSHYKGYSLITELKTDANGVLTAIDLTSDNTTFAGMWGYARGKGAASIDGYLPDGVTFNMIANNDGTFTPDLTDTKYGMTLSSVTLISTSADGTKDASGKYANESYDVSKKQESFTHVELAYTGDKAKIEVPALKVMKLVRDENGDVVTEEKTTTNRGQTTTTTVAKTEEVEVSDSAYNLIKLTYQTANEKMPFDCYYCIDGDFKTAAEDYIDNCVGDKDGTTVYSDTPTSGYTTNRDGWTAIMGTVMLRQLASWGAVLNGTATSNDLSGELGFIDTVSGATKTSEPFVGAVADAYGKGYIKGVSENVKITIDGATSLPTVDVNANPQDRTSVSVGEGGQYVVKTSFQQYGGGRLSLNKIFLLDLSDTKLGTQGVLTLAKTFNVYNDADREQSDFESKIVAQYAPSISYNATEDVKGNDDNCEYVFSKPTGDAPLAVAGNGTLTIKNSKVTHVIVNYTVGHGDVAIVYDLAEMAKVPATSALLEAATSADPSTVVAARQAFDATPYDVRPFVTGLDTLEAAEAAVKADEAAHTIASVTLAKTSVVYNGKAQKPAVTVKAGDGTTLAASAYDVSYASNTNVGTATVTVKGKGSYTGTAQATFKITQASQTLKVKVASKAYKAKNLKKKAASFKIGATAKTKVSYKVANADSKKALKVTSAGKVTVKKGTKKGTYKITVSAAKTANYKAATKTVTVKVK